MVMEKPARRWRRQYHWHWRCEEMKKMEWRQYIDNEIRKNCCYKWEKKKKTEMDFFPIFTFSIVFHLANVNTWMCPFRIVFPTKWGKKKWENRFIECILVFILFLWLNWMNRKTFDILRGINIKRTKRVVWPPSTTESEMSGNIKKLQWQ